MAKSHIILILLSYDLINALSPTSDVACSNPVVVNGSTRVLFIDKVIFESGG